MGSVIVLPAHATGNSNFTWYVFNNLMASDDKRYFITHLLEIKHRWFFSLKWSSALSRRRDMKSSLCWSVFPISGLVWEECIQVQWWGALFFSLVRILDKPLNKQSRYRWLETPWRTCTCDVTVINNCHNMLELYRNSFDVGSLTSYIAMTPKSTPIRYPSYTFVSFDDLSNSIR